MAHTRPRGGPETVPRPWADGTITVDVVQVSASTYNDTTFKIDHTSICAYYYVYKYLKRVAPERSILVRGIPMIFDLYEVIETLEIPEGYDRMIMSCIPANPRQLLWVTFINEEQAEKYTNTIPSPPGGMEIINAKGIPEAEVKTIFDQWSDVAFSLHIVERKLFLRIDTVPQCEYYREFMWVIDTDIQYQPEISGIAVNKGGRNRINFLFMHPFVNCWAKRYQSDKIGNDKTLSVDRIAYMIGYGIASRLTKDNCLVMMNLWTSVIGR